MEAILLIAAILLVALAWVRIRTKRQDAKRDPKPRPKGGPGNDGGSGGNPR